MRKRTTTRWRSMAKYQSDTYIRVGRVFHQSDVPADIIRLQIKSKTPGGSSDYAMTIDEAAAVVAVLSEAVANEMLPKSDKLRRMFR